VLSLLADHRDTLPDPLRPLGADPLVLARCTTILHQRGMATVSPHGLQLHRIPAALLRARRHEPTAAAAPDWAAIVVRLLDGTTPDDVRIDRGGWPLWGRMLPHVLAAAGRDVALETIPAEATRLLDRAATYLLVRGEFQTALAAYQRAYAVRRDTFGHDHPRRRPPRHPQVRQPLASDLFWLADFPPARELQVEVLGQRRRVPATTTPTPSPRQDSSA
jgi:hypothetical protein